MVSIYKRGSRLYLQYTVNGKRKQKSTGLDDTPANRKLLKARVIPELERKLISGEVIDKKKPTIFNKFADMYCAKRDDRKTAREIGAKVDVIRKRFGLMPVTEIKRRDVIHFADTLLVDRTPKTVRGYIGILRGILRIAMDYEEIQINPADSIELPKHVKKQIEPFTPEEVERLISAADGWFKNFLAISFYTGMRTGEVLALRRSDIDLDAMEIRIDRGVSKGVISEPKTENGIRSVPIFSSAKPYITNQLVTSRAIALFPKEDGKFMRGADVLTKKWRKVCKRAGVKYRMVYATRHTFITSMLKSGTISILELAQIVGHANSEPIMRNYAKFIKGEHLKISREIDPFCVTKQPTHA